MRDLGNKMDEKLIFTTNIQQIVNKSMKTLGSILKLTKNFISFQVIKLCNKLLLYK